MIVVSDTSPLTNLAAIGQFDLLHQLYGQVHIPEGVWHELSAEGKRWPGRDEVAAAGWVERRTVLNESLVMALRRDLDRGEAETIALALELQAELVLLDEREGRRAAQRLGLQVVGVVGILLEAKTKGAIEACARCWTTCAKWRGSTWTMFFTLARFFWQERRRAVLAAA
jgi:predicted nucleic acid-binding protein